MVMKGQDKFSITRGLSVGVKFSEKIGVISITPAASIMSLFAHFIFKPDVLIFEGINFSPFRTQLRVQPESSIPVVLWPFITHSTRIRFPDNWFPFGQKFSRSVVSLAGEVSRFTEGFDISRFSGFFGFSGFSVFSGISGFVVPKVAELTVEFFVCWGESFFAVLSWWSSVLGVFSLDSHLTSFLMCSGTFEECL